MTCRILVCCPGIEPGPQLWKLVVLTTRPPGNYWIFFFFSRKWEGSLIWYPLQDPDKLGSASFREGFSSYRLSFPVSCHYWNLTLDFSQMNYRVKLRSAFSGKSNISVRPAFSPEKDGKFGGERDAICLSYIFPVT